MAPKKEKAEKPAKGDAGMPYDLLGDESEAHTTVAADMVLHYLSESPLFSRTLTTCSSITNRKAKVRFLPRCEHEIQAA